MAAQIHPQVAPARDLDPHGDVSRYSFSVDRQHSLQEFVLPEKLRYDSAFDNFAAEDEFPAIDLADGGRSREETITSLARAAETWGFFKVVNHGVPLELLQRIVAHVRGFFAKPIEEKMQVKSDIPVRYEGYTPGTMIVDVDGQHPCWTERLLFPRKADLFRDLAHQVWQEDDGHDQISQDILHYFDHMDALTQRLIELLSEASGVESQQLAEFHDSTCGLFIAGHYPPCPRPELARGLRPHTDPHTLAV